MLRDFSRVLRELWRISGETGGAYRPDLHYMRGPGPKWHAKHAGFVSQPQTKQTPTQVHRVAQRRA